MIKLCVAKNATRSRVVTKPLLAQTRCTVVRKSLKKVLKSYREGISTIFNPTIISYLVEILIYIYI